MYAWIMIPFMKVLGSTRLALRLPMLLVSLAALPIVWDFSRRMLGKGFALVALLVIAINPWHVLQSRWAIDCNIMPHTLLLACYLLYLGRTHRSMLYPSMVAFAMSIYGYGLACFSVPVILLCMAAYYVARKKASLLDIVICVIIFFGLSGPFFYTMAINALGLEGTTLGPITLPFFAESKRTNDMPFFQLNPYSVILSNWIGFLYATVIGGGVNRNDVVYYPMIFACAYGLYLMAKRLRTASVLVIAMLAVSFTGMNVVYFTDEAYQNSYRVFQHGFVDALEDTWDWDYDEVYVTEMVGGRKLAEASIMFAHDIDYAGRSEQVELLDAHGEPTGWYFTERYKVISFAGFEPDPMACTLYIVHQKEKACFDEAEFLITDYGDYAAVYPRYWAE